MPRAANCAVAFLIALFAAPGAGAEERQITPQLCAARTGDGGTATLSSGCVSSSLTRLDGTPTLEVMEDRALITITGSFRYDAPANGIALTDCGGGAIEQIALPTLSARRYIVTHDGGRLGVLDLTTEPQACVAADSDRPGFDRESDGANWQPSDRPAWGKRTAARLLDLLPRPVRAFPASLEGAPEVSVDFARSPSEGPDGPRIELRAMLTGLPDDSVEGVRYIVLATPHPDGWRLDEMWRQLLCARGGAAGQWQAARCP
ncbi:MAG: hypothetical protein AAGE90_13400 [Pseudomonadota bacterium]